MGVYRSDQAQLTFGFEAYPGAYAELGRNADVSGGVGTCVLKGNTSAHAWNIQVDNLAGTNYTYATADWPNWVGESISIGNSTDNHTEIRIVEHVAPSGNLVGGSSDTFTFYLNAPLAFAHIDNESIEAGDVVNTTASNIFTNVLPGVYETVDVPDPDMAIEARYFLGTASKRNFYRAYKGQQAYTGSLPGFVLLDGKALRFPFGKIVTSSVDTNSASYSTAVKLTSDTIKGQVWINVKTDSGTQVVAANDLIVFDARNYNATIGSATVANTMKSEVRKVLAQATVNTGGSVRLRLDYPLQYPHSQDMEIKKYGATTNWKHEILETVDLDTITWHVNMKESSETNSLDFARRYYGGKVGSATIAADEGGMLTMSWDAINFLGMVHNQQFHTEFTNSRSNHLPFYTMMQDVDTSHVQFPTSEPYYFSQGAVSLFGTEIATIRSFALSVSNNEEPRYYIQRRYGRNRGPVEIREQQREYSLAVTLALPDATQGEGSGASTAANLFKELILAGDYGSGMQGFNVTLRFDRGVNDYILITVPFDPDTANNQTSNTGGNQNGAFIRTAPHSISGENPLQVEADILFRNLKIEIADPSATGYYYP